ncbi:hypothetical protein HJG54_12500 [Leptolyngbya sp. NK1-12]|uniref:WD40 repeat domain-containing protein n=1 Tax=Leptolyngbya sp. NK1-12 TaxID=2547451 RepID=A0AA96WEI7_9CYAN|nr:WD40 repeat domain-containing protein [Leptolyngbya sp. NK1-12]WNZ23590.1 hypothetical protein HJG54_12500 [Leptolyngbya sp. NK1-12]
MQQPIKAIIAVLFLSSNPTVLLQTVNPWQVAADQTRWIQAQASILAGEPIEEEYTTRLLDLSGREVARFAGKFDQFSPDGARLLTASSKIQVAYLFDRSGRKLLQFNRNIAEFSPDGRLLAVVDGGTNYLYDASGRELAQLPGRFLGAPIFSPDSQRIVSFAEDSTYLLNAAGQQIAQIQGPFRKVLLGNGFSPDSQQFVMCQRLEPCFLFNASGQLLTQLEGEFIGFSPDGQKLITSDGDSNNPILNLYNRSGQKIAQLPGAYSIFSPVFSPDGQLFLVSNEIVGDTSYLYNSSGEAVAQLRGADGKFSSSGKFLVTVSNKTVYLYNIAGNEIAQVPGEQAAFLPGSETFVTFIWRVGGIQSFVSLGGESRLFESATGSLVLLQGELNSLEVMLFGTDIIPSTLSNGPYKIELSFVSSDGQCLVTTDSEASYLYDAAGNQLAQLPGVFQKFSPNGQYFVTTIDDTIYLFDRSGTKRLEIAGEFRSFSPDGQHLVITTQNSVH